MNNTYNLHQNWFIVELELMIFSLVFLINKNSRFIVMWQYYQHASVLNRSHLLEKLKRSLDELFNVNIYLTSYKKVWVVPHTHTLSSNSSYRSHAGLHSTGREEPGFAAQLPPRFPQVSSNSHHTTTDCMSCSARSRMPCYIDIQISAARLVANAQNTSHEIDFLLWKTYFALSDCETAGFNFWALHSNAI